MVIGLEGGFDLTGVILTIGLLSGVGHYIYGLIKRKNWKWEKSSFFVLLVLSLIDLILLLVASIAFFLFNKFPEWIPIEIIKVALITAILFTANFVKKNYNDVMKP